MNICSRDSVSFFMLCGEGLVLFCALGKHIQSMEDQALKLSKLSILLAILLGQHWGCSLYRLSILVLWGAESVWSISDAVTGYHCVMWVPVKMEWLTCSEVHVPCPWHTCVLVASVCITQFELLHFHLVTGVTRCSCLFLQPTWNLWNKARFISATNGCHHDFKVQLLTSQPSIPVTTL